MPGGAGSTGYTGEEISAEVLNFGCSLKNLGALNSYDTVSHTSGQCQYILKGPPPVPPDTLLSRVKNQWIRGKIYDATDFILNRRQAFTYLPSDSAQSFHTQHLHFQAMPWGTASSAKGTSRQELHLTATHQAAHVQEAPPLMSGPGPFLWLPTTQVQMRMWKMIKSHITVKWLKQPFQVSFRCTSTEACTILNLKLEPVMN